MGVTIHVENSFAWPNIRSKINLGAGGLETWTACVLQFAFFHLTGDGNKSANRASALFFLLYTNPKQKCLCIRRTNFTSHWPARARRGRRLADLLSGRQWLAAVRHARRRKPGQLPWLPHCSHACGICIPWGRFALQAAKAHQTCQDAKINFTPSLACRNTVIFKRYHTMLFSHKWKFACKACSKCMVGHLLHQQAMSSQHTITKD